MALNNARHAGSSRELGALPWPGGRRGLRSRSPWAGGTEAGGPGQICAQKEKSQGSGRHRVPVGPPGEGEAPYLSHLAGELAKAVLNRILPEAPPSKLWEGRPPTQPPPCATSLPPPL